MIFRHIMRLITTQCFGVTRVGEIQINIKKLIILAEISLTKMGSILHRWQEAKLQQDMVVMIFLAISSMQMQ